MSKHTQRTSASAEYLEPLAQPPYVLPEAAVADITAPLHVAPKPTRKPRGPNKPVVIVETVDASPEPPLPRVAQALDLDTLHQGQRRTITGITPAAADKAARAWAAAYCPDAQFVVRRAPSGGVWLFRLLDAAPDQPRG